MVLFLNNYLFNFKKFLIVWQLLGGGYCCHAAENLADPTRPPDVYSGVREAVDAAPPPVPELQSILLSATRQIAVISGQAVPLGGKFGDAKLVKLTPREAVLRTGDTLLVLKLFPEVEKKENPLWQGGDNDGNTMVEQHLRRKSKND